MDGTNRKVLGPLEDETPRPISPASADRSMAGWARCIYPVLLGGLLLSATALPVHADETATSPSEPSDRPAAPAETEAEFAVEELEPAYWAASPLPISGLAMYYNPGVMERVLAFRRQAGHVTECPECIGYAAMLRAGDLDRRVWLKRPGHLEEGPFWVIDVAATKHIAYLLQRGWVVDVDYRTAQRWGMRGPIPVTVLERPSPEALLAAVSLPLYWSAVPAPAENFHAPPASPVEPRPLPQPERMLADQGVQPPPP